MRPLQGRTPERIAGKNLESFALVLPRIPGGFFIRWKLYLFIKKKNLSSIFQVNLSDARYIRESESKSASKQVRKQSELDRE